MHHAPLVATIAAGLVVAFALGFLARRVGLPPLVGYLAAGIAIGPHTPGFVGDVELAAQIAEVGVILLMFGVGLHFSVGDLLAVRRVALPGAVVQIAIATGAGALAAHLWGWGLGGGLVFGLSLSVASTVVLLRALEGRGALESPNGRIAVGWLVVEDLAMVMALVLLPALVGSGAGEGAGMPWGKLAMTVVEVAAFAAVMLVFGRRAVPWMLAQVARTGSRELFTLAVLALAVGIAFGSAAVFGVSFALGAFFAGVVLSESDLSHQAAADSLPLQDAFAVLFFVSVGMLFDPWTVVSDPLGVVVTLAIILLVKSLAAAALVLALGHPARTALTISASLAQVGEFSFILVGLGVSLGALPEEGRDLVLAGSILSITLNPAVFAAADRLSAWIEGRPGGAPAWLRGRGDTAPPDAPDPVAASGHAVVVGHGRVGGLVCRMLEDRGLPLVVVDLDRRKVEDLRASGTRAVWGDAASPGVLEAASVAKARLLVITVPASARTQAQRIVETARRLSPAVDVAVRASGDGEMAWLERHGVGMAAVGERELALGIGGYSLVRLGVPDAEARAVVQRFRAETRVGGGLDEIGLPARVPELRPHAQGEELEATR